MKAFIENRSHFLQYISADFNDDKKEISDSQNELVPLQIFANSAKHVPAYKEFLKKHKINPKKVSSIADFEKLPVLTKSNYCSQYSIENRCLFGNISEIDFFSVSSGSTGTPFLWGRSVTDELRSAFNFESIFRYSFNAHRIKTLVIVCFPLGSWVGGVHTINCMRLLKMKGYLLSVITPGNNVSEAIRAFNQFSDEFGQVVLIGYPPFIRTIIDEGLHNGVKWQQKSIRLIFAGEGISENWREAISEKVGLTSDLSNSASVYGTADAGVLGNETILSISLRKFILENQLMKQVFGEAQLPSLFQFFPNKIYFETIEQEIIFSVHGAAPLVRYNIQDRGGIIPFAEMLNMAKENGYKIPDQIKHHFKNKVFTLPFVYLYGRSDQTVSFFGANIYAETISECINDQRFRKNLSGKFVLKIEGDSSTNLRLKIYVQLKIDAKPGRELESNLTSFITNKLLDWNSEFRNYVPKENQKVIVELRSYQDTEFFPTIGKHKYSIK